MVGLDRADAREDPRVDAVAPSGRDVQLQVLRWDVAAGELGGAVAAGEQRPQAEDRAEGAHHDQEEHGELGEPARQTAAGARRRRATKGAAREGVNATGQLPTAVTVQPEWPRVSSKGTV